MTAPRQPASGDVVLHCSHLRHDPSWPPPRLPGRCCWWWIEGSKVMAPGGIELDATWAAICPRCDAKARRRGPDESITDVVPITGHFVADWDEAVVKVGAVVSPTGRRRR